MARVYQAANMAEAHVRVAIVNDRGQADLLVHRVASLGQAQGDALWYVTRNKQEATVWFYPCSIGMAEVRVCFVDTFGEAGWTRPHPRKSTFG